MKKIKDGELKKKQCGFCSNKAEFRSTIINGMFCCDAHRQNLVDAEKKFNQHERELSEADCASWMRM